MAKFRRGDFRDIKSKKRKKSRKERNERSKILDRYGYKHASFLDVFDPEGLSEDNEQ